MGKLLYGESGIEIGFGDRTLAHIQIVVGSKLRRKESFFLSWKDGLGVGSGRSSIWVDTSIPMYFRFSESKPIIINRQWLDILTASANSPSGLMHTPEPGAGFEPSELPQSRI